MENPFDWLIWSGVAVALYVTIAACVRYVHHWRRGAKTLAAQAALQTVIYLSVLVTIWCVYRAYTLD